MSIKANFNEIINGSMNEVLALAKQEKFEPAHKDVEQVLFIGIDIQNDFMDNQALGVPGSVQDVNNICNFIYGNLDKITKIMASIDTHIPHQIFHPCWWVDKNGNNPSPFTLITLKDLDNGVWMPVINPIASRKYVEGLEAKSKKNLCIWPYHCLQGTTGCALVKEFFNMMYFHEVVRKTVPQRVVKGQDPLSEMYGIIKPEFDIKGYIDMNILNAIQSYDKIIISGEARSHCVLESIGQILDYYSGNTSVTNKIYILEDCMSNIPGFEQKTEDAFEQFKKKHKVNILKSTEMAL